MRLLAILIILFPMVASGCVWIIPGFTWGIVTHVAAHHKLKSCQAYIECIEEGRDSSECEKLREICHGSYKVKIEGEYEIIEAEDG